MNWTGGGHDRALIVAREVGNYLMSIFGPREDDVAMIALRRTSMTG
jgi:hypothetical protein